MHAKARRIRGDFDVRLHTLRSGSHPGSLVVVSQEGRDTRVVIDFSKPDAPRLGSDEKVVVVFSGGCMKRPLRAEGEVLGLDEDELSLRYEFRFGPDCGAAFTPIKDRRSSIRVRPYGEHSGGGIVQPTEGGMAVEATIYDISATGISILVTSEAAARFAHEDQLNVVLLLPDQPMPLQLVGTIRYERPAGSYTQYGLEFDMEATPDFERQRAALFEYVTGQLDRKP